MTYHPLGLARRARATVTAILIMVSAPVLAATGASVSFPPNASQDAMAVAEMVADGIAGKNSPNNARVVLPDFMKRAIADPALRTTGRFSLRAVTGLTTSPENLEKGGEVTGVLVFGDAVGRAIRYGFSARVDAIGGSLVLQPPRVRAVAPKRMRAAIFVVPEDKVPEDILSRAPSNLHLLTFAAANAMSREEAAGQAGKRGFVIFSFLLDRPLAGDRFLLVASSSAEGSSGKVVPYAGINHVGWPVLMAGGRFASGAGDAIYFKLVHIPEGVDDPKKAGAAAQVLAVQSSQVR